ncbi:MarR family winged helix-turn-helix transcriptional regulator [Nocardioides sp. T2.26MG-1]|uniref:MarR family winged helix-turn-helix transcriptional regulator n=1 Tax=Nocardioides sp. T2.26MG-1 TaxID=3041166 RepID=UPI0024775C95|nr:MarR family transcriptional regulator [Nocardioides sp. T2.26MG-1]CAI9416377.1 HTH-type transcriptional repressor NicR [Nocardioides sp. T2.26MG-1]
MTTLRRVADRPTWLLSRANARAQGLLAEAFAAAGVRGYHFRLMAALEQLGPCSQADLGRATAIDRSDVVAVLDDLDAWGLTRRKPDPADRRRNVVLLTEDGAARLEELDAVLGGVQEAVLEPLSAAERATLLRLLRRLAPEG